MPTDPLAGYTLTPAERERMLAHIAGGGTVGTWQRGDRPPARQTYGDRVGWGDMSPEERRALGLVEDEAQYKDAGYWWKQWWRKNTAAGRADTAGRSGLSGYAPGYAPAGGYPRYGTLGSMMGVTPALTAPRTLTFGDFLQRW